MSDTCSCQCLSASARPRASEAHIRDDVYRTCSCRIDDGECLINLVKQDWQTYQQKRETHPVATDIMMGFVASVLVLDNEVSKASILLRYKVARFVEPSGMRGEYPCLREDSSSLQVEEGVASVGCSRQRLGKAFVRWCLKRRLVASSRGSPATKEPWCHFCFVRQWLLRG